MAHLDVGIPKEPNNASKASQMRESQKDFYTIHFWRYRNKREASIGSKCVVDLSRIPLPRL
jgi:hypothetical protein